MDSYRDHSLKVKKLQEEIVLLTQRKERPISLLYQSKNSNTTRSKSYKKSTPFIDLSGFNQILQIDPQKQIVIAEPRVTIEKLVKALLPYHLSVPIVPEFKHITVGGAILGGAAESGSHKWGIFSDACLSHEIICGDGTLLKVTPSENEDIFFALPGSYGSLGVLVSSEIKLIPIKEAVHLRYYFFSNSDQAIDYLQELSDATTDFLDGIVFSKEKTVIITGEITSKEKISKNLPRYSLSPSSEWYYQHVKNIHTHEEWMSAQDYFFRYDQGAFWMGSYLFELPLLRRFISQGILKLGQSQESFTQSEMRRFRDIPDPNRFSRTLFHQLMTSQNLWKLFHMAEKWIQDRVVIQDFCIPTPYAKGFLKEALDDPGTFPLWLCPIKGTNTPQILAPHLKTQPENFINIGIYGLPSYFAPIKEITRRLEKKTKEFGGRKVLYSRSYYTPEEFWAIYPRVAYEIVRTKTKTSDILHNITDKVLSV